MPIVLTRAFTAWYKPDPTDTRYSPLLLETHQGLPPAYLQICGLDPLRDDGLIYEKVLREAGVPTKLEMYELSYSYRRLIDGRFDEQIPWRASWV